MDKTDDSQAESHQQREINKAHGQIHCRTGLPGAYHHIDAVDTRTDHHDTKRQKKQILYDDQKWFDLRKDSFNNIDLDVDIITDAITDAEEHEPDKEVSG